MKRGNFSRAIWRWLEAVAGQSAAAQRHPVAFPLVRLALLSVAAAGGAWLAVSPGPWKSKPVDLEDLKLVDHVRKGVWLGLAGTVALALGLAVTARFWMATAPAGGSPTSRAGAIGGFWWVMLPVLILAAWMRVPLMTHSLYGDEVYSVTRFIHGDYKPGKDGQPRFREVPWMDTVWGYRRPNNHQLFSVVSRLSHDSWKKLTKANRADLNVAALRLPALAAGLGSVLLAAWFLWSHGYAVAGTAAGVLMALHPWHIAHSVEVRGYALVFFFGTAVLLAAARALQYGQWKWWLVLGAAQFCLLLTYPAAVHILLPLVAVMACWIWGKRKSGMGFPDQFARLLVANVAMTALLLPLVLPCVPQLALYLAGAAPRGAVTAAWIQDVSALFLTGTAWQRWDAENPLGYSFRQMREAWPVLAPAGLTLLAGFGVAGYVRLFRSHPMLFWVLLPFWTAPVVAVAHAAVTGAFLYTWYVIFSLPVWLICSALGMDTLRTGAGPGRSGWLLTALGVTVFAVMSHPQRRIIRRHSAEPLKEVVAEMHRLRETAPGSMALLAACSAPVQLYDPAIHPVPSAETLRRLQQSAAAEGRPLYLALNYLPLLKTNNPELHHLILESGQFVRVAIFYGLDFEHRNVLVYRYQPPS